MMTNVIRALRGQIAKPFDAEIAMVLAGLDDIVPKPWPVRLWRKIFPPTAALGDVLTVNRWWE